MHLNKNDILDQPAFDNLELSAKYWLDVRHCYCYRKKKIFGCFNNEEPEDIRFDICKHIMMEMKLYAKVGTVHLLFISSDIEKWLKTIKNNRNYGDPLMLYALLRTFQRHSVVLCANRAWSTVGTDDPINSDRLLEICHVKLVYIRHNMFGELREKSVSSIPSNLSNLAITDATSASVLGTNKTGSNINVCLDPSLNTTSTTDKDVPILDTFEYVDSSEFSDFDGSSDDTIIYSLPDNSTNTFETPSLNINDTTDRPIGTGYYTKVDDKDDEITSDMPWGDTGSSVVTKAGKLNKNTTTHEDYGNIGNNTKNVIETSVSVLSLNCDALDTDDVQGTNSLQDNIASGINSEHDRNVQGTNDSQDNTASSMNSERGHNVQGTNCLQDNSVSGINNSQENIVSGINVAEDHNYAVKSINSTDVTGKNNACDSEITDVNGLNSVNSIENAQTEISTKVTDVEIELTDSDQLNDAEEHDSTTDGNSLTDTINKLHNLFLVKNPEAALYKMWEKDANKKRLSVKIITRSPEALCRAVIFYVLYFIYIFFSCYIFTKVQLGVNLSC